MRKIIVFNRISIDGYFASLNQETWGMDWFIFDPEVDKAARELGDSKEPPLLLMGGITYSGFERSWVPHLTDPNSPPAMRTVAEELTKMTKLVFSKSIKTSNWENTRLFTGDLTDEIRKIKQDKGADIMIMGSGSIIQQLAKVNLIDDYIFIVSPVIAGQGKTMFSNVPQIGLKLMSSQSFASGNLLLHYTIS